MSLKVTFVGRILLLVVCSSVMYRWTKIPAAAQSSTDDSTNKSAASQAEVRGVFKVGGGVSPPQAIYAPDPEYSEQARRAGYEGTCVLWLVINPDGTPNDIKVARSLGMGLDEKAVEAVSKWRFKPALKAGQPVAVQINVEVSFRIWNSLYESHRPLYERARSGDPEAEFEMSQILLRSKSGNVGAGYTFLQKAADQGLPKAQFAMGEYLTKYLPNDPVSAYVWYSRAQRRRYKHSDKKMRDLASKMSPEQLAEAKLRMDAPPQQVK